MLRLLLVSALVATSLAFKDERIVGGNEGKIDDFPYQISLQYVTSHMCGGSIISPNYILTAAHCLQRHNIGLTIRAGSSTHDKGGKFGFVRRVMIHPEYNNVTQENDIALLELTMSLEFEATIQAIPLADEGYVVPAGRQAVVSGWGSDKATRAVPNLRYTEVTTIDRSSCRNYYNNFMDITDGMICTLAGGKDACQGDSGGPLVLDGKLIGVVSWGVGCARPDKPGVYTNVASYRKFIRDNAGI